MIEADRRPGSPEKNAGVSPVSVPVRAWHDRRMQRVLVVDDDVRFLDYARRLLDGCGGVEVRVATDGASGISAASLNRPDIVLLDIRLPDMSGLDVARHLLRAARPPRVFLVSTADPADYLGVARDIGAEAFIAKSDLTVARVAALVGAGQ
jgi:CheY-like chemotaxis protein